MNFYSTNINIYTILSTHRHEKDSNFYTDQTRPDPTRPDQTRPYASGRDEAIPVLTSGATDRTDRTREQFH